MNSLDDILKMAQNVQAQMAEAQASLDGIEVEGASGGGLVKIRASAKGRIIGVSLDDSLIVPSAAFNDARAKADAVAGEAMGKMTQGIPLPPGFKLPI
jgi:DNA-binding protein YbaB